MLSRTLSLFSRTLKYPHTPVPISRLSHRITTRKMSDLSIELTAPNGVKYTQPTGLFINNEFVASSKGNKITSINPTDESEIASVHAAEPEDVDKAVDAAKAAFKGPWREMAPSERGDLMFKLSELVEKNKEVLATIETWDNGLYFYDHLVQAYADSTQASHILWHLGRISQRCLVASSTTPAGQIRSMAKSSTHRQRSLPTPFVNLLEFADRSYVCIMIGDTQSLLTRLRPFLTERLADHFKAWNYPLAMAAWKLGPAIAAGNTVVLKSAEQTPLSILVFATLVKEAGFPPGVINILNGYGRVAGATMAQHPGIEKIAFTGSTATGREIMKMASINLKNITLETGGKSPLLVFDDADLDQAVKWSHIGIMSNQGQICTSTSRILVQEGIYDKFIEAFKKYTSETSKVGDPFSDDTFQGPQVTKAQYERVLGYIDTGKSEGATLAMGGEAYKDVGQGKGFFVNPTMFTNVKDSMKIFKEEVFGPFVVVVSFKDEKEALALANNTTYGLGSAIFTNNIVKAHRVARKIEAGMVWINSSQDSDFRIPFGGVKVSAAKYNPSLRHDDDEYDRIRRQILIIIVAIGHWKRIG